MKKKKSEWDQASFNELNVELLLDSFTNLQHYFVAGASQVNNLHWCS